MPRASRVAKEARQPSVVTVTDRQKIVADAILEGHTPSQALRAGGYHPTNGKAVMRNEEVQTYLAEARAEIKDLTTIKRLDVLNGFMEAIDMARTLADPANMINGYDKIAKVMGFYAPETKRIEITGDAAVLHSKFKQLTDAELLEIAAGRSRVIEGEVTEATSE